MSPTLYHIPRTISSPIVQVLLELHLTPDTVQIETLSFPELKKKWFLAINPMGTVPAFTDDSDPATLVTMWESGAVMTLILENYDVGHRLHPQVGDPGRARFLQLHQYITTTVYPFVASLFCDTLVPTAAQDSQCVRAGKAKWSELFAPVLESELENNGGGPYLMGKSISAVDFLLCKPLGNIRSLGMLDETPKLQALFKRVESMPSYAEAYGTLNVEKSSPQPRSMVLVPGENGRSFVLKGAEETLCRGTASPGTC